MRSAGTLLIQRYRLVDGRRKTEHCRLKSAHPPSVRRAWRLSGLPGPRRRAAAFTLPYNMYKLYNNGMSSVTMSEFRSQQSSLIAAAQREPVEITSRGAVRRAVVVSPDFYDRALRALEDQADVRAAAAARKETGRVSQEELEQELGL